MSKEQNVINYYVVCNKLKNIVRTGWQKWNVKRERIESVAEHIYGVQMLAIAIKSEYEYDIDIMKVLYMITIHELAECVVGDLIPFQITAEEKENIEHTAVHEILKDLLDGKYIEELFLEFDSHGTKEANFAFQCDKLEADLQSKLYGEENCVNLNDQQDNELLQKPVIKKFFEEGCSWAEMWLKYSQSVYPYDENFKAISNYALNHDISNQNK